MEIQGTVLKILTPQKGVTKGGKDWEIQELIIATEGKYPKEVCVRLFGKALEHIPKIGDKITATIEIESREYNMKYYTSVTAFFINIQKNENEKPIEDPKLLPSEDLPF